MRALLPLLALAACQAPAPPRAAPPALPDDGLPLKSLGEPQPPESGCALFLWTVSPVRKLVLETRQGGAARIALAEGEVVLPRTATQGPAVLGLTPGASYSDGRRSIAYAVAIQQRPDVRNGATVPRGTLRLDLAGGETVVMPVTGLIRCA